MRYKYLCWRIHYSFLPDTNWILLNKLWYFYYSFLCFLSVNEAPVYNELFDHCLVFSLKFSFCLLIYINFNCNKSKNNSKHKIDILLYIIFFCILFNLLGTLCISCMSIYEKNTFLRCVRISYYYFLLFFY